MTGHRGGKTTRTRLAIDAALARGALAGTLLWVVAEQPPLQWSKVGHFDHWPKCDYWVSPIPISNRRRLQTIVKCYGDPIALRRLKRYWKRMAREGKMK